MPRVPVVDLLQQVTERRDELLAALAAVVDSGRYILGEQVAAFEAELAAYLGAGECIGVANGTDALRLCLLACGIGAGDEVITTAHTSVATVSAIEQTGATPVLADIEPRSRCLDPDAVAASLTARTRAVIAVHMFGHCADMDALGSLCAMHGVRLIEDCAQAIGARYHGRATGTLGDMAAFSFYPTKNLAALGDGGAVATRDPELAQRVRRLRQYGWDRPQYSVERGINSRLDELQAAVLRINLPRLDAENAQRRAIADNYSRSLAGSRIEPPPQRDGCIHAWHVYAVETEQRDALRHFLTTRDIQTSLHYPTPIHRQPAYAGRLGVPERFPATERLYRRMVTLPLYPQMGAAAADYVIACLREWGTPTGVTLHAY